MPRTSCVVFELEDGVNPAGFMPKGEDMDLGAKLAARRLQGGPWPQTAALVDGRRIVAANEDILRRLRRSLPRTTASPRLPAGRWICC